VATTATTTNQDAVLKDWYTDDKIKEQTFGKNPLLALMRKERAQMAGGRRFIQPVEFGHSRGANSNYAKANTNGTTDQYEDFQIQRKTQYQRIQVAHELMFAMDGGRGSFRKALDVFDRGFKGFGEKLGRRLYRTEGGSVGKLANSTVATTTITWEDKASGFQIMKGDKLTFAAADGTGSERASGASVTVVSVDIQGGTAVVDQTLNVAITGIATTDFVFIDGDFGQCVAGLEGWLPAGSDRATRLAASFNGVTRSDAPDYLGGIFVDGTSLGGLDEVFIKLVGDVGMFGGETDYILANPRSLSDFELISNSKVRILQDLTINVRGSTGDVLVGFSGYKVNCGGRVVKVIGDRNCPSNRVYALQLDTWTVYHTGDWINWGGENYTGSRIRPSETSDDAYSVLASYMNVGCSAPGWNGVARIPVSV